MSQFTIPILKVPLILIPPAVIFKLCNNISFVFTSETVLIIVSLPVKMIGLVLLPPVLYLNDILL